MKKNIWFKYTERVNYFYQKRCELIILSLKKVNFSKVMKLLIFENLSFISVRNDLLNNKSVKIPKIIKTNPYKIKNEFNYSRKEKKLSPIKIYLSSKSFIRSSNKLDFPKVPENNLKSYVITIIFIILKSPFIVKDIFKIIPFLIKTKLVDIKFIINFLFVILFEHIGNHCQLILYSTQEDLYSTNPIIRSSCSKKFYFYSTAVFPEFTYSFISPNDEYYVYTNTMKRFLVSKKIPPNKIKIKNFKIKNKKNFFFDSTQKKALILDIFPAPTKIFETISLPSAYYIKDVVRFYRASISYCKANNFEISIKSKKNRIQDLSHHNYKESIAVRDFLDLVDYINNQNDIILLKGKYDALEILDNYSLIIAMPITTPLVIAKMAGKDCLVHDPYSYENLPETTFEQIKEYSIPILYD